VAVTVPAVNQSDTGTFLDFDDPESARWQVGEESSTCVLRDGVLIFEAPQGDFIDSPDKLRIPTRNAALISIRMKVTGVRAVKLYWRSPRTRFSKRKQFQIYVPGTEDWQTYNIRAVSLKGWTREYKFIDQLRVSAGRGARVEIDFVRILTKRAVFSREAAGVTEYYMSGARTRLIRPCLFAHSPSEIEYTVVVPQGAWISTGLGIVDSGAAVKFSIVAKQGASEKQLLTEEVNRNDGWHDAKIDMSEYANKEIGIVFKTDCEDIGQVALWSNPILYKARAPRSELYAREAESSLRPDDINVILYVIDAVRADHLDVYGYSRETGPTIRSLAEEGVRFARCFAQDTWTKASISSLFSGTTVWRHGVKQDGDLVPGSLALLPEILRQEGYATACITENRYVGPITDLDRGFSHYGNPADTKISFFEAHTLPRAAEFVRAHKDRGFWLYIHTEGAHWPYIPAPEFYEPFVGPGEKPTDVDLYDGEIAAADEQVRRLISMLRDVGVYDNTLLIITADHGEAFGEHAGPTGHGGKPYNELIHVPLIMRLPGLVPAGKVVRQNVQLLDLAPTILDVFGLPANEQFEGASLLALLDGQLHGAFDDRSIYSRGRYTGATALVKGDWKLLKTREAVHLYDIRGDYGETKDLASENQLLVTSLLDEMSNYTRSKEKLARQMREHEQEARIELDQGTIDDLKALGYMK
jgi:arylsulfatase A-like enzyme